jgi:pimeloyl-ACP methyl ester carboxylesterase
LSPAPRGSAGGQTPRIEPLHFAGGLFGCFHRGAAPARTMGLVICPPQGHEAIQFHRALRQLAVLLSDAGFPVLRFDPSGCGDSAGGDETYRLARWREDVRSATTELKARSGVSRVGLVGMRLGGALAVEAGVAGVECLVLWDPVLYGRVYLTELRAQHANMLAYAHVIPGADGAQHEILGFPLPPELVAELEAVDLTAISEAPASKVLLVESHAAVDPSRLAARLEVLGVDLQRASLPTPELWEWVEDFGRVHVPHKTLTTIVRWAEQTDDSGAAADEPELPAW